MDMREAQNEKMSAKRLNQIKRMENEAQRSMLGKAGAGILGMGGFGAGAGGMKRPGVPGGMAASAAFSS